MPKKKPKPPLSDLENKVMSVVWKRREVTADQVRTDLAKSHPLADSTIRTVLRRLATKGYVTHQSAGRTYIYSPAVGSENVAVDAVRSIIDRFCNGSVESLLLGMIDREVISPEKLRELAARISASSTAIKGSSQSESSTTRGKRVSKKSKKKKGS